LSNLGATLSRHLPRRVQIGINLKRYKSTRRSRNRTRDSHSHALALAIPEDRCHPSCTSHILYHSQHSYVTLSATFFSSYRILLFFSVFQRSCREVIGAIVLYNIYLYIHIYVYIFIYLFLYFICIYSTIKKIASIEPIECPCHRGRQWLLFSHEMYDLRPFKSSYNSCFTWNFFFIFCLSLSHEWNAVRRSTFRVPSPLKLAQTYRRHLTNFR